MLLDSDLGTDDFIDPGPRFLLAEVTIDSGSGLGFFSSLVFSATGSFPLVFALLQSSFPEGFGLSLYSGLGCVVVVDTCSFFSEEEVLPFIVCCPAPVGATGLGSALVGISKVLLDEDAAL